MCVCHMLLKYYLLTYLLSRKDCVNRKTIKGKIEERALIDVCENFLNNKISIVSFSC